ncbi:CLUMA_CG010520, isoform A [Clunio marinus]|uniref:CLUMA_CG010520, isoform A n=1 Tax=Clunio marinus TaxID=568069 RepID=A0A1J1IA80_9DIPT|nr:CLUMA_CG010520, isoform A [Clunio marinus]
MKTISCFLCAFMLFLNAFVQGKVRFSIDDNYEVCSPETDSFQTFDTSKIELVSVNDTHTYLNGSLTTLFELPPWPARFYTEKLYGDKWEIFIINRQVKDFCSEMHAKNEFWYEIMKHFNPCPYKIGDVIVTDMLRVNDIPLSAPPSFKGRWRGTYESQRVIDGKMKTECFRINAEFLN